MFALIHRQQSCLICAPSEPLLCAVAHDSSRERCIGSRCRSRVRAAAPSVSAQQLTKATCRYARGAGASSQATFEERWTLGRGLQVRSVSPGPSSVCVRARALSRGSGLSGLKCLVRVHCSRSWRTSCASTPSSSSASHSLRRPFGLVDPPWRGTGPSVGPSPLNRTAAKAVGRSVRDWVSG